MFESAGLPLQGVPAVQHDAWVIGMTTTDDFTEAEVNYQATLPLLRASLTMSQGQVPQVPIVTGFLGRGLSTGAFCLPAQLACQTGKGRTSSTAQTRSPLRRGCDHLGQGRQRSDSDGDRCSARLEGGAGVEGCRRCVCCPLTPEQYRDLPLATRVHGSTNTTTTRLTLHCSAAVRAA